jgi:NOL1/NOP2/fmu family ribosome biogenesis protein
MELEVVRQWVKESDHQFIKIENTAYAIPRNSLSDINILSDRLHITYFGTMIGELIRDKLVPAHSLAMCSLVSDKIEKVELDHEQAIVYLKKKDLKEISAGRGWKLVAYKKYPIGWINALPNRINNYYPKELRILKDI